MRLYNRNLLPAVVQSDATHAQVDCLATADEDGARVNVFVVNRSRREIQLTGDIDLPEPLHGGVTLTPTRFTAATEKPVPEQPRALQVADEAAQLSDVLPAKSVTLCQLTAIED
jgi:hypothetical protein